MMMVLITVMMLRMMVEGGCVVRLLKDGDDSDYGGDGDDGEEGDDDDGNEILP